MNPAIASPAVGTREHHARCLPITNAAALRIFRDVFAEYSSIREHAPVDLTAGEITNFLIDLERLISRALGRVTPEDLDRIRAGSVTGAEKLKIGRYLAASPLWPVPHYFRRS